MTTPNQRRRRARARQFSGSATQLMAVLDDAEYQLIDANAVLREAQIRFADSQEHVEQLRNALHALGKEVPGDALSD